jgi:hypothetical protein
MTPATRIFAPMALMLAMIAVAPPAIAEGVCDLPQDERAPVTEPADLCGVTTVQASTSSIVRLQLSQDLTIDTEQARDTLFELAAPGASVAGFVLVAADGQANALLVGGWHKPGALPTERFLLGAAPIFGATDYSAPAVESTITSVSLGAGIYHLSVFSNGGPISLALNLAGLSGSNHIDAVTPSGAVVRVPDPGVPAPGPAVASSVDRLADWGVTIGLIRVDATAFGTAEYLLCRRRNFPEGSHACGDDEIPEQSDDPGLTIFTDRGNPSPSATTRTLMHVTGLNPPGPFAMGFASATQGVIQSRTFIAAWVPLQAT